ncbi:NUDIX domain-containing protein [Streptomyces gardneri]|uniref:NUDIX domain-containing protein n=1 Tax=Streptomyces gardneri TaxID=66892 RepID=UPI0036B539CD
MPGGHVGEGETSRAAAVRELEEETGVHVAEDTACQSRPGSPRPSPSSPPRGPDRNR